MNKNILISFAVLVIVCAIAPGLYGAPATSGSLFADLNDEVKLVISYKYSISGKEVGTLKCSFEKKTCSDHFVDGTYLLNSALDLDFNKIGIKKTVRSKGIACFDAQGDMYNYVLNSEVNDNKIFIKSERKENSIYEIMKVNNNSYTKDINAGANRVFLLDNNMMGQWAVMSNHLDLKAGKEFEVNAFVPQSMKIMILQMEFVKNDKVTIDGKDYSSSVYIVKPIRELFWISGDGILVKIEDPLQKLTIEMEKYEITKYE